MLDTITPETCGIDSNLLAAALEQLSQRDRTLHGVLVVKDGFVVADACAEGNSSRERHIINSCTKTVLSALIGIAIEKRLFTVDDAALDLLPPGMPRPTDSRWAQIKVHHLLSMSSGISWPQYGPGNVSNAMGESEDWIKFILQRPMAAEPGSDVNYSNGDSHLLSAILQQATGKTALEFAQDALFQPLEITDTEWMTDPQGRSIGSAALYLRPMDMAKIGLLYLKDGCWNGQQLVPSEWIAKSWLAHSQMLTSGGPAAYGYYWWLYPEMKLCQAWGGAGQRIAVLRNTGTVVVVTADNPDDTPRSPQVHAFYSAVEDAISPSGRLTDNPHGVQRLQQAQRLYVAG